MKYILDTDTIIYFLKNLNGVAEHVSKHDPQELAITIITFSELLYGAFKSTHREINLRKIENYVKDVQIITFCEKSAYIYAEQKTLLKSKSNILDDMDLMIASITMRHNCTLVTNNTKHFARLSKLPIENWCE